MHPKELAARIVIETMKFWDRAAWTYLSFMPPGILATLLSAAVVAVKRRLQRPSTKPEAPEGGSGLRLWLWWGAFLTLWSAFILCLVWQERTGKLGTLYRMEIGKAVSMDPQEALEAARSSWTWTVTWIHALSVLAMIAPWAVGRWFRSESVPRCPGSPGGVVG